MTSYESTTSYTYDSGNRMTQAVDSAGGTITEAYESGANVSITNEFGQTALNLAELKKQYEVIKLLKSK